MPILGCALVEGGRRMNTSFVATTDLETAPLADGAVLYNAKTGKFVMLNRSAERLWSDLAKARTEDELVRGLCRTYPGIEPLAAQRAVSDTLESLRRLDLVLARAEGDVGPPASTAEDGRGGGDQRADYAPPSVTELGEEDLLKVFQMTAAEISVALCWWGACTRGCP
jgi:coenzyme PQQ synthesis protein D (PqqD)